MTPFRTGFVSMVLAFMPSCGAAPTIGAPSIAPAPRGPRAVPPAAAAKFAAGLAALAGHDRTGDWTRDRCATTAALFIEAAEMSSGTGAADARFDAAIAYQRCGDAAAARREFAAALRANPACHGARMHLALYAFSESGEKDVDGAIAEMHRAALDSKFQNVEALVNLANLQMRRHGSMADDDGANDLERAKTNLHRALAVDDSFLPAYDQLAIYHLETAQRGGRRRSLLEGSGVARDPATRSDTQTLEIAALVCSHAIRKDPSWAPIHNTAGLIQVELGNLGAAVMEFNTARSLDPRHFEAHMNAAAVNLSFRGFSEAERAYRAAVGLRPQDYEAHLGLALALRGQIGESNFAPMTKAVERELSRAKELAPERAETYYNEAILRQEYKAKLGGAAAKHELLEAKTLLSRFVDKAGTAAEYADAVKRSHERMAEIDQILGFIP